MAKVLARYGFGYVERLYPIKHIKLTIRIQLIPIVVGWLLVSPKCNSDRLDAALKEANESVYIATINPDVVVRASSNESHVGAKRAFMFNKPGVFSPSSDEGCTSPIFNYSRFLSWMIAVERVAQAFELASERAERRKPVSKEAEWKPAEDDLKVKIHVDNRRGSIEQVIEYCSSDATWRPRWHHTIAGRMITASAIGLALQWATTGSAVMILWFTPKTGLGCRSGAYLIYAIASTIIWGMMVTSSVITYYAVDRDSLMYNPNTARTSQRIACSCAVILNRVAKVLAAFNSIWIIAACVFQFTNVFNTCWCNSSQYGFREESFVPIILGRDDEEGVLHFWAGAVSMALASVFLFIGYIKIFLNPPRPSNT